MTNIDFKKLILREWFCKLRNFVNVSKTVNTLINQVSLIIHVSGLVWYETFTFISRWQWQKMWCNQAKWVGTRKY